MPTTPGWPRRKDPGRRKELLDEAAHIAKDFVGRPGAGHRLSRSALPAAALRRPGGLLARAAARAAGALGRSGPVLATAGRGAHGRPGPRPAAAGRRSPSTRSWVGPTRRWPRCACCCPTRPEDEPPARSARADPGRRRARLRPAGCSALQLLRERPRRRRSEGAAFPSCSQVAIRFSEGEDLREPAPGVRRAAVRPGGPERRARPVRGPGLPGAAGPRDRGPPAPAGRGGGRAGPTGAGSHGGGCGLCFRRPAHRAADPGGPGARPPLGNRAEAAALFEEAIAHRAAGARAARRDPAPARGALRRAGRRGQAALRPRAAGGGRAQAGASSGWSGRGPPSWRPSWAKSERALAAWEARLALDPADLEALAAETRVLRRGCALAGADQCPAPAGRDRGARPTRSGPT